MNRRQNPTIFYLQSSEITIMKLENATAFSLHKKLIDFKKEKKKT